MGMSAPVDALEFPAFVTELGDIQTHIEATVRESVAAVHELGAALLAGQTGMVRPGLVLAAAEGLAGRVPPAAHRLAELVELVHLASLLHEKGAGLPVDPGEGPWSAKRAILLGDLFLARAMTILAELGRSEYVEVVSHITSSLAEGQILSLELARRDPPADSLELYLSLYEQGTRLRTGEVFAHSLLLGGLAGEAPEAAREVLLELGREAGQAARILKRLQGDQDDPLPPGLDASLLERVLWGRFEDRLRGARSALGLVERYAPGFDPSRLEAWLDLLQERAMGLLARREAQA